MMVSLCELEVEEVKRKEREVEPGLDRMAQQVHNLFNLKNFYNQMDSTAKMFRGSNIDKKSPH